MQARVFNLRFNVSLTNQIALVLEACEDSDEWRLILERSKNFVESFPGGIREVYILGSRKVYSISIPRDFEEGVAGWYRENRGRVNLVRTVFETLVKKRFKGMVAIFCSNLPLDIDDWGDSEIIKRSIFIKKGGSSSGWYNEVDLSLGETRIAEFLKNPVKSLEVRGAGFVPLKFQLSSAGRAEVVWEEGDFKLVIFPGDEKLDLHLKAISFDFPKLYVKREKGVEVIEGKTEHEWFRDPEWKEINKELSQVIEKYISRGKFKCPRCGNMHSGVLICPEDGSIILEGMPFNTCVILRKNSFLCLSDNFYAYLIDDKIVTRDGKLYQLGEGEKWNYVKEVEPYEKIGRGVYALFIRV